MKKGLSFARASLGRANQLADRFASRERESRKAASRERDLEVAREREQVERASGERTCFGIRSREGAKCSRKARQPMGGDGPRKWAWGLSPSRRGGISPYGGPPGPSGLSAAEVARVEQLRRGIRANRPASRSPPRERARDARCRPRAASTGTSSSIR